MARAVKPIQQQIRELNLEKGRMITRQRSMELKVDKAVKKVADTIKGLKDSEKVLSKHVDEIIAAVPGSTKELVEKSIIKHLERMPKGDLRKMFKDLPFKAIEEAGGFDRIVALMGGKKKPGQKYTEDEDRFFKKVLFDACVPLAKGDSDSGGGKGVQVNIMGISQGELAACGQGEGFKPSMMTVQVKGLDMDNNNPEEEACTDG